MVGVGEDVGLDVGASVGGGGVGVMGTQATIRGKRSVNQERQQNLMGIGRL
jgi:hypothetical protein